MFLILFIYRGRGRGATGTSVDFTQYDACQFMRYIFESLRNPCYDPILFTWNFTNKTPLVTDLKAQYISLDFKNIKLVGPT